MQAISPFLDVGYLCLQMYVDAFIPHSCRNFVTHLAVKGFQQIIASVDQVSLYAQPVKDACELNSDVATTNNHSGFG